MLMRASRPTFGFVEAHGECVRILAEVRTSWLQLKAQALDVTNTRDVMYKPGEDAIIEVSENGPQYYFGVRVRFQVAAARCAGARR
jgi:hypothetical protein